MFHSNSVFSFLGTHVSELRSSFTLPLVSREIFYFTIIINLAMLIYFFMVPSLRYEAMSMGTLKEAVQKSRGDELGSEGESGLLPCITD